MKVSEYRSFLSMVEILNTRVNYEDILHENKIYVNKSLQKLNRKSVASIVYYFSKSKLEVAKDITDLCNYYNELLQNESLEVA